MLKNHLNIALRIFQREKVFTTINVLGLTLGMGCTIMIALWIQDEYQYDRFHEKGDQIYQVMTRQQTYQTIFYLGRYFTRKKLSTSI